MTETIQTLLLLVAVLVIVAIVARRFNIAPSILLIIAGILLALTPGLPRIELAPELVLLGILPPLIYSAGVAMSWREFRFNLRPIVLLAFGCVLFTASAVATMAYWLLGMPLAVGFVLGAIVAPPDVVAPLSIVRQLGVPRRLVVILEGEGLANDATALILYRFAVAAAGTGLFSLGQAVGTFALIVVGEIAFGIGIGWLSLRLRRWARDPRVEITLSLLTPYAAFLVPANLGGSGVLATVAAGLFVSWNGPLLIPAATRLQGIFFWDLVIYLLEGLVFLVTGLQMRTLLDRTGTVLFHDLVFAVLLTVIGSEGRLTAISWRRGKSGEIVRRPIRHLFLFIGAEPNTDWLAGSGVALDPKGFVLTGADAAENCRPLETSLPGVFAIGDVRSGSIKRVAAAVGEGAQVVAALHAIFAAAKTRPQFALVMLPAATPLI